MLENKPPKFNKIFVKARLMALAIDIPLAFVWFFLIFTRKIFFFDKMNLNNLLFFSIFFWAFILAFLDFIFYKKYKKKDERKNRSRKE